MYTHTWIWYRKTGIRYCHLSFLELPPTINHHACRSHCLPEVRQDPQHSQIVQALQVHRDDWWCQGTTNPYGAYRHQVSCLSCCCFIN